MQQILSVMFSMKQFDDATFVSIQCVMRLASRVPSVATYMLEDENKRHWGWFQSWLNAKLKAASAVTYTNTYNGYASTASNPKNLARSKALLQQIDDLLQGRLRLPLFDDEDDPQALVGLDICIRQRGTSMVGKVLSYDDTRQQHQVQFESATHAVDLLEMNFAFGNKPPETSGDDSSEIDSESTSEPDTDVAVP